MLKTILASTVIISSLSAAAFQNTKSSFPNATTTRSSARAVLSQHSNDPFTEIKREIRQGTREKNGNCSYAVTLTEKDPYPAGRIIITDANTCSFALVWGQLSHTPAIPNGVRDTASFSMHVETPKPSANGMTDRSSASGTSIREIKDENATTTEKLDAPIKARAQLDLSPEQSSKSYGIAFNGYFGHSKTLNFARILNTMEWRVGSTGEIVAAGKWDRARQANFAWNGTTHGHGQGGGKDSIPSLEFFLKDKAVGSDTSECSSADGSRNISVEWKAYKMQTRTDGTYVIHVNNEVDSQCAGISFTWSKTTW